MQSLTAPERETALNFSDADDFAYIWTAQRPIITKLKRNPSAELVKQGHIGTTAWAEFRLPADLITFRSGKRTREMTPEQRAAARDRLAHARQARQPSRDSEPNSHNADSN
jgi:hypothetical protein